MTLEPTRDHDQTMAWDKQQYEQEEGRLASRCAYDLEADKITEPATVVLYSQTYKQP